MRLLKGLLVGLLLSTSLLTSLPNEALADVYVKGYYRKDGTYVKPHYRSDPDGNVSNNWSTKGNINPYTGEEGTIDPYKSSSSSTPKTNTYSSPTTTKPAPTTIKPRTLTAPESGAVKGDVLENKSSPTTPSPSPLSQPMAATPTPTTNNQPTDDWGTGPSVLGIWSVIAAFGYMVYRKNKADRKKLRERNADEE